MAVEDLHLVPTSPSPDAVQQGLDIAGAVSQLPHASSGPDPLAGTQMLTVMLAAQRSPLLALDLGEVLHRWPDTRVRSIAAVLLDAVPIEFQVPRWHRCMQWLAQPESREDGATFINEGVEPGRLIPPE